MAGRVAPRQRRDDGRASATRPSVDDRRGRAPRATATRSMFLAVDGQLAGLIGVADPIKATAPEAIDALHAEGLRVVMLTGDNAAPPRRSRRTLGIDDVQRRRAAGREARGRPASCSAQGTSRRDGRRRHQRRAGAGPSRVGIAMGTGTDVAIESAGITLVNGDLRGIVRARRLSRADDAEHPAEPVSGVRLQRARRAGRGRRAVSVASAC